jgi:hypothetical protein
MNKDIDKMTAEEWIAYRQEKIKEHYKKGFELNPCPECKTCDMENKYVCFECELTQLEVV